jgi:CDP-glucose 4,6-dehydratase
MFCNIYRGRRVLVTGHTGFKGSWLATWLLRLGAQVIGISKDVPTQPAMFEELALGGRLQHLPGDIRDLAALRGMVEAARPDFVFHLAAQAIVSTAYREPVETMTTNVVGTLNLLEVLRGWDRPCTVVLVTSDKCYDNVEWVWGYREIDALGGKDIYSGSKGAAELVIKCFWHSFFGQGHPVRLTVARAGNVIGGGDWARDRIVVDCMRAWSAGREAGIRNPAATRPWQHVLEPLSGYLNLGMALSLDRQLDGEPFNFGPGTETNYTVAELLETMQRHWPGGKWAPLPPSQPPLKEATLLKLNCDKAAQVLRWKTALTFDETARFTVDWYRNFYRDAATSWDFTCGQLTEYEGIARERQVAWTRS